MKKHQLLNTNFSSYTSKTEHFPRTMSSTQTKSDLCIVINCNFLWVTRGSNLIYRKGIHYFLKRCLSHGKVAFYANYHNDDEIKDLLCGIMNKGKYKADDFLFIKFIKTVSMIITGGYGQIDTRNYDKWIDMSKDEKKAQKDKYIATFGENKFNEMKNKLPLLFGGLGRHVIPTEKELVDMGKRYRFLLVDDQVGSMEKAFGDDFDATTIINRKTFNPTYDLIRSTVAKM